MPRSFGTVDQYDPARSTSVRVLVYQDSSGFILQMSALRDLP